MTTNKIGFGKWLYLHRKAKGLTQSVLADEVECSKGYISQLERGVPHSKTGAMIRPSEEVVEALAEALGADTDEARLAAGYARTSDEAKSNTRNELKDVYAMHDKILDSLPDDEARARFVAAIEAQAETMLAVLADAQLVTTSNLRSKSVPVPQTFGAKHDTPNVSALISNSQVRWDLEEHKLYNHAGYPADHMLETRFLLDVNANLLDALVTEGNLETTDIEEIRLKS